MNGLPITWVSQRIILSGSVQEQVRKVVLYHLLAHSLWRHDKAEWLLLELQHPRRPLRSGGVIPGGDNRGLVAADALKRQVLNFGDEKRRAVQNNGAAQTLRVTDVRWRRACTAGILRIQTQLDRARLQRRNILFDAQGIMRCP